MCVGVTGTAWKGFDGIWSALMSHGGRVGMGLLTSGPHIGGWMTQPILSCSNQEIQRAGRKEPGVLPSSRTCWAPQLFVVSFGPDWLSHGGRFWLTLTQSSCPSHLTGSCGLSGAGRVTSSHPTGSANLSPGWRRLFLLEQQPGPPVPCAALCCRPALIQDTGGILGQQLPSAPFCCCKLPVEKALEMTLTTDLLDSQPSSTSPGSSWGWGGFWRVLVLCTSLTSHLLVGFSVLQSSSSWQE